MVQPELILSKLVQARTSADIEKALESYCRGLKWNPFNNDMGNKGQIKLASDPMRALVERITNADDAVIERLINEKNIDDSLLKSPLEAVNTLLPLEEDRFNKVFIEIDPRQGFNRATVDVLDYGTGIAPERFTDTILSLSKNNKIGHPFYIGVYGQGGATSIGGVNTEEGYVVIISRTSPTSSVGFTVIRHHAPSATDRRGYYEYLVGADGNVLFATNVPKVETPKKIDTPKKIGEIAQGTLVRHFGYDLSSYSGVFKKQATNIGKALNTYLFRPLLPLHYNLHVKRGSGAKREHRDLREGFYGDRLISHGAGSWLDNHEDKVEYAAPVSALSIVVNDKKQGTVRVSYYVLALAESGKQNIALTHPSKSVLGTFNGQTQDERTLEQISGKIGDAYPFLCKQGRHDLIVEIQVDGLKRAALDNLLSTTRESFVDGETMTAIRKAVTEALLDDEALAGINQARYEGSLSGRKSNVSVEAIQYATEFVKNHLKGVVTTTGGPKRTRKPPQPPQPIKLQSKEPTFIRFVAEVATFNIESDSRRYFMIETDAPNGYADPKVEIKGDGDKYLIHEVVASLHNGRLRLGVTVTGGKDGMTGMMRVSYSKTVTHEIMYEIVKQSITPRKTTPQSGAGGTQFVMPKVEFAAVKSGDHTWEVLGLRPDEAETFAFRPQENGDTLTIYFNEEFPPFVSALDGLTEPETRFVEEQFQGGLTVAALFLSSSKTLTQDETPKVKAERCATAGAILMSVKKLLETRQERKAARA